MRNTSTSSAEALEAEACETPPCKSAKLNPKSSKPKGSKPEAEQPQDCAESASQENWCEVCAENLQADAEWKDAPGTSAAVLRIAVVQ